MDLKAAASHSFAISSPRDGVKASNSGSSMPGTGAGTARWAPSGRPEAGSSPATCESSAAWRPARRRPAGETSVV